MCDQPPCEADIIEWFAIQTHRLLQGYKRPHDPHNMP
jgi:hypothetical protein